MVSLHQYQGSSLIFTKPDCMQAVLAFSFYWGSAPEMARQTNGEAKLRTAISWTRFLAVNDEGEALSISMQIERRRSLGIVSVPQIPRRGRSRREFLLLWSKNYRQSKHPSQEAFEIVNPSMKMTCALPLPQSSPKGRIKEYVDNSNEASGVNMTICFTCGVGITRTPFVLVKIGPRQTVTH